MQVADHYVRARKVPPENLLRLQTLAADPPDEISRPEYARQIERPIAEWLGRRAGHDRILYIVLTKGIPLRIVGTRGRDGTQASVDSELTLLYRRLTGQPAAPQGRVRNPYFAGEASLDEAKRFTHREHDVFLVTRLDGFSVDDVLGLIDRGLSPAREGRILLDQKAALENPADGWLKLAADRLAEAGHANQVVLEATTRPLAKQGDVLGYFSWGTGDPAITTRDMGLSFVPGALAAAFVSTNARTFRQPPADWTLGAWGKPATYFAGSPQGLIADLIRAGATGVAGHADEPYLDGSVRPDVLFPAYLAGFNLAEAFYLAIPYLSWQTVIVGDPLCAPFRGASLAPAEIDAGIDREAELPVLFAERRLSVLAGQGLNRNALKLLLRAEVRLVRDDRDGAREALEAATAAEERLNQAHMLLASLYQQAGEHEKAMERYRTVLANTPREPVALNNLAYGLAVYKNQPAAALPLAQKAHTLAGRDPAIGDTLGWIHHLLGNQTDAVRLLTQAVKGAPENPEIRLHAAVAHAAAGQLDAAKRELAQALELQPDLASRSEVLELRARLGEAK